MPSQTKSPYSSSFGSAIKRGTPAGIAVNSIAKRVNKAPSVIFSSLYKAGLCERQKFNGQWIYWPTENLKRSATQAKLCQHQMWQSFIDWCLASGQCKPEQLERNIGSQSNFMSYCRKYFNRQLTGSTTTTTRKSSTKSRPTSYKFPRSTSRRYRKAA